MHGRQRRTLCKHEEPSGLTQEVGSAEVPAEVPSETQCWFSFRNQEISKVISDFHFNPIFQILFNMEIWKKKPFREFNKYSPHQLPLTHMLIYPMTFTL